MKCVVHLFRSLLTHKLKVKCVYNSIFIDFRQTCCCKLDM